MIFLPISILNILLLLKMNVGIIYEIPYKNLVDVIIFSQLYHVIVRPTQIIKKLLKYSKFLIFVVIFQ